MSFTEILNTPSTTYGDGVRSARAEAHGIARGMPSIQPDLAQGLFATPAEHQAILRISSDPGDLLEDPIALPRGLALKVMGVKGARMAGPEGDTPQNLIMVTPLAGDHVDVTPGGLDALREVTIEQGGTWELRVQLDTDFDTIPVEDPTQEWGDSLSHDVAVTRLVLPPRLSRVRGETGRAGDRQAYNVRNAIDADRPPGGMDRVRRDACASSPNYPGRFDGCPVHQPRSLTDLALAEFV
jgi:hypothetical protein